MSSTWSNMYLEYFSEYHTYNLQSGTHLLVLQEPPTVQAALINLTMLLQKVGRNLLS